jgi:hypothetical protein
MLAPSGYPTGILRKTKTKSKQINKSAVVIYLLEQCPTPCVPSYTKTILNTKPTDNQPPEIRGRKYYSISKCLLVKATNHNF